MSWRGRYTGRARCRENGGTRLSEPRRSRGAGAALPPSSPPSAQPAPSTLSSAQTCDGGWGSALWFPGSQPLSTALSSFSVSAALLLFCPVHSSVSGSLFGFRVYVKPRGVCPPPRLLPRRLPRHACSLPALQVSPAPPSSPALARVLSSSPFFPSQKLKKNTSSKMTSFFRSQKPFISQPTTSVGNSQYTIRLTGTEASQSKSYS